MLMQSKRCYTLNSISHSDDLYPHVRHFMRIINSFFSKIRAYCVRHGIFYLCKKSKSGRTSWLPLSHFFSASSKLFKGVASTSFLHFLRIDSLCNPVKSDFLPHNFTKLLFQRFTLTTVKANPMALYLSS